MYMPDKSQEHTTTKLIGEYDGYSKESTSKESPCEEGSSCKEGRMLHS